MIWLAFLLIGILVLLPPALTLRRNQSLQTERDSALALYRGQLAELERDHATGLIGDSEHAAAQLEIQRRLLAADAQTTHATSLRPGRIGIATLLLAIPALAVLLYIVNGHPSLPPQPLASRAPPADAKTLALIAQLRDGVSHLPPDDPRYIQGHLLLGQAEAANNDMTAAAHDWHLVLDRKFDPALAIQTAEAQSKTEGHISADSLDLYRRALAQTPPNAPYRTALEARIAQGEHDAAAAP